jgi:hypothetical protein
VCGKFLNISILVLLFSFEAPLKKYQKKDIEKKKQKKEAKKQDTT